MVFWEGSVMSKKKLTTTKDVFLFLLPAIFLFGGILIAPIIMSGYYSFFDWHLVKGNQGFVGFENYIQLFTSSSIDFGKALGQALLLAALSVFIQLPISLGLALLLGRGFKGEKIFLSIFFIPVLISTVVIGQLWLKIYTPDKGLLNTLLINLGFDQFKDFTWLSGKTAIWACFIPTLWQFVGYHMLLMYAGVKSVPTDYREAAKIDGATEGQVNRYIVIPYIKGIIKVSVIFAVTGSLKSYDMIKILLGSQKSSPVEVPTTRLVNQIIERNNVGKGSAIAVLLIILCFAFALIIGRVFREDD